MNNGQDLNTQTNAPEQRTLGLGNSATAQQSGIGLSNTDSTMGQGRKFSILERIFNGLDAMGGGTPLYLQQQQLDVHRQDLAQQHQLRRDALDQQLKAQEENKRAHLETEALGLWRDKDTPLSVKKTASKALAAQGSTLAGNLARLADESVVSEMETLQAYLPKGKFEELTTLMNQKNADLTPVESWLKVARDRRDVVQKQKIESENFSDLLQRHEQTHFPPGSPDFLELQDLVSKKTKQHEEAAKLALEIQGLKADTAFKQNAPKEVYSGPSGPGGDITTGVYDPRTQKVRELSGLPLHRTQDVSTNEQAHARDRLDSIAELKNTVDQYRKVLRPENVGALGDLRSLVFGIGEQANAFSIMLQRHAANSLSDVMSTGSDIPFSEFNDSNLSKGQLLQNTLAYKYARMMNAIGVISDKDYKASKESLGMDGWFTGATAISKKLDALVESADRLEPIVRSRLRDPSERPGVTSPSTKPKYNTIEEYKKARGIK